MAWPLAVLSSSIHSPRRVAAELGLAGSLFLLELHRVNLANLGERRGGTDLSAVGVCGPMDKGSLTLVFFLRTRLVDEEHFVICTHKSEAETDFLQTEHSKLPKTMLGCFSDMCFENLEYLTLEQLGMGQTTVPSLGVGSPTCQVSGIADGG
jgi:hypothetical protein